MDRKLHRGQGVFDDVRALFVTGAGWFPDPGSSGGGLRWWNGTNWTSDVYQPSSSARLGGPLESPPAVSRGFVARRPVWSLVALLTVAAAGMTVVAICLPRAWDHAVGPSRQAGREYATRWLKAQQAADRADDLTKSDVQWRCIAEANRVASQGVDLANGTHLRPGRVMRGEFTNACIDEAMHHVGRPV